MAAMAAGLAPATFTASKPGMVSFTGLRPVRVATAAVALPAGRVAHCGYRPLKVVAVDYPRPDLDHTANFLEAAALSAYMRDAQRPDRPLKVVIAGAGGRRNCQVVFCFECLRLRKFWIIVRHLLQCNVDALKRL